MTTLTDLCEVISDCVNRTAPQSIEGRGFAVGTPAMRGNRLNLDEAIRIDQETYRQWTRKLIPRAGDILISREAPVGLVVRVPAGIPIVAGQRTMVLRTAKNCDDGYLYYALLSPRTQSALQNGASGSTVGHLRIGEVSNFKLPFVVPPLPIQRAIGEVLGALDDKIAVNRRIAHSARILGEALFERNTRHSAQVPLDRLSDPLLGGTPSRAVDNYWNGDVPWVSVRDISAAVEEAILSTEESITQEGSLNSRAKVIPAGSVILSARGTVGSVARLIIPAAFNQSCYAFTPESIPPGLLYYSVRHAAKSAKLVAHGSVFSTITMNTLSSMMVPRVDPAKASALEAHLVALLQSVDAALQESQTLATLRDTLLPALMDGTLRVKDAISQAEEVL